MWNPTVFPANPEQWSNRLHVTLWSNGRVTARALGTQDGIEITGLTIDGAGLGYEHVADYGVHAPAITRSIFRDVACKFLGTGGIYLGFGWCNRVEDCDLSENVGFGLYLKFAANNVDVIANNIAASHVAGFKKVAVSFEAVDGGEIARSTHDRLKNEMPGSFPVMKNQVDFEEGELRQSNNPMDMALRGEGFFGLINANGDVAYTRDGQFYLNADGIMVNSMGHEFAGNGGNNIQTVPGGGDPTIDKEGQVFQNGQLLGQVGVFVFDDPLMQLRKVGGGFVAKDPEVEPEAADAADFVIMQGYVENSNVSAIQEMIGLIEVSRAHEANQKMIQHFDQNIGKAIGTLGATS